MAFIDRIFAVTVAVVTGGGDGIASDIFLVVIRSLASAAIILEGAWVGPVFDRIVGTKKGMPAAILCFAVSLVIPAVYRMDFRTAQFGRFPVLLLISAAAAYGFLRQAAELLEKYSSVFTYFGRYFLIVMATHLEWYLVNLVWGGVAAVLRPFPPQRARPSSPQGGSRLPGGAPLALRQAERGRGPAGPRRLTGQMAVEVPEALRLGGGEHRGDVHLLQASRRPSQAPEVHQHA